MENSWNSNGGGGYFKGLNSNKKNLFLSFFSKKWIDWRRTTFVTKPANIWMGLVSIMHFLNTEAVRFINSVHITQQPLSKYIPLTWQMSDFSVYETPSLCLSLCVFVSVCLWESPCVSLCPWISVHILPDVTFHPPELCTSQNIIVKTVQNGFLMEGEKKTLSFGGLFA